MPPTRRVTDQPVNEVTEKRRREPEQKIAPLFDPKARGVALRAAFLKAAHPEVAPEPEASTEPELETEREADSLPELEPELNAEADGNSAPATTDEAVPTISEPDLSPSTANEAEAKEQQELEEAVEEAEPSDESNELREDAGRNESDAIATEPTDEPVDTLPVDTPDEETEDESRKEGSEENDIKPQIERELFAEYVVFEEEDHESQQDAERESSEDEPASEPDADKPESAPESADSSNDASLEEETGKVVPPVSGTDEKPVPAPVPIIEEVKATVIEEPTPEPENNQVVVKPQKLGFFARLKLLFFGGNKH